MIKVTTVEFLGRSDGNQRWGERRSWHHIHSLITGNAYFLETYGYLRDKFYAWPINAVGDHGKREYRDILEKRIAKSGIKDLEPGDRRLIPYHTEGFLDFGEVVEKIFNGPTGEFKLSPEELRGDLLKQMEGALTMSALAGQGLVRANYTNEEHREVYRTALMTAVSPAYNDLTQYFPGGGDNDQTVAAQPIEQIQATRPDHFGSW